MGAFGSKEYAEEEMIAKFGRSCCCAVQGCIVPPENSVTYAAAWAKRLKVDPTIFNYVAKLAKWCF